MDLKVIELDDYYNLDSVNSGSYDEIPENNIRKPRVHFKDSYKEPVARKMITQIKDKPSKMSYDDILSKMGMFVSDGKLHLADDHPQFKQLVQTAARTNTYQQQQNTYQQQQNTYQQQQIQENIPQNSYIYNKYFNQQFGQAPQIMRPMNAEEYRDMLIKEIIQKKRIKQMKSTKLLMPTSNINFSGGNSANMNKLFNFSRR